MNDTKGLAFFNKARLALSQARGLNEVVKIRDAAVRMKLSLKQAKEAPELVDDAVEIELWAERRAGEMLDQGKRNGHRAKAEEGPKYRRTTSKMLVVPPTLKEIGISWTQSSRWQKLTIPKESAFKELILHLRAKHKLSRSAVLKSINETEREKVREIDRERIRTMPPLTLEPGERVPTILIDPPWDYRDVGYQERSVSVQPDYAQMPFEEIKALTIPELVLPDAHIYLWAPQAFIFKAKELLDAWGFRYINLLTWVKNSTLVGAYFGINSEHVLFGVRGSSESKTHDYETAFACEMPGPHSRKPEVIYEIVESVSTGPWLEIFARSKRWGWKYWTPPKQQTTEEDQ